MRLNIGPVKFFLDKNWIGFYIQQRGAGLCPDNAGFFGRVFPDSLVG
jgi:hypothetical protein